MIDLPLRVGHATDDQLKSGVTVILPDSPAVASCHIAGGGPGTRETDLLSPENTVERIDAIVLSGGSAFGLAAADGVSAWLARKGRGFAVGEIRVPIVPAAILFDLRNGGDKSTIPGIGDGHLSPYALLGRKACQAASTKSAEGSLGAGAGAFLADVKGGFGAASASIGSGGTVAAFVAVNAAGSATYGGTHYLRAAAFERDGEFGGYGLPSPLPEHPNAIKTKPLAELGGNTTIAVIATNLPLTKAQLKRLAVTAHDGIALAVYPAHTPFDGDTIFALSTASGTEPAPLSDLSEAGALASATLARAIGRAVARARPAAGDPLPVWTNLCPHD
ncbi:MAG TPA: P1 family peptidase [Afifellaceae bacterium]|nr:P1 family peptidase [Afifellaceae bacterium]